MDNYKIGGNKDLARDPETNAIVNVNSLDYMRYIAMRKAKSQKNKVVDTIEEDLNESTNSRNIFTTNFCNTHNSFVIPPKIDTKILYRFVFHYFIICVIYSFMFCLFWFSCSRKP